jgi:phosphoserine phosphatase RsbU/P
VTLFFARLDPQARQLRYASAGHNPPLLYRSSTGQEAWLKPTGPAIGLVDEFGFQYHDVQLSQGDILLLYTDGLVEALDSKQKEQFGYDRLSEVVRQNEGLHANELVQKVRQALNDFTQGALLADDITLIVCRVN